MEKLIYITVRDRKNKGKYVKWNGVIVGYPNREYGAAIHFKKGDKHWTPLPGLIENYARSADRSYWGDIAGEKHRTVKEILAGVKSDLTWYLKNEKNLVCIEPDIQLLDKLEAELIEKYRGTDFERAVAKSKRKLHYKHGFPEERIKNLFYIISDFKGILYAADPATDMSSVIELVKGQYPWQPVKWRMSKWPLWDEVDPRRLDYPLTFEEAKEFFGDTLPDLYLLDKLTALHAENTEKNLIPETFEQYKARSTKEVQRPGDWQDDLRCVKNEMGKQYALYNEWYRSLTEEQQREVRKLKRAHFDKEHQDEADERGWELIVHCGARSPDRAYIPSDREVWAKRAAELREQSNRELKEKQFTSGGLMNILLNDRCGGRYIWGYPQYKESKCISIPYAGSGVWQADENTIGHYMEMAWQRWLKVDYIYYHDVFPLSFKFELPNEQGGKLLKSINEGIFAAANTAQNKAAKPDNKKENS